MFPYSDPVAGTMLETQGALQSYRALLHKDYRRTGEIPGSGFVPLEAFDEVDRAALSVTIVDWLAFPLSVVGTSEQIDEDRFRKQDEYVEWRVERRPDGSVSRVTFCTEFSEYYEALAGKSLAALQSGIAEVTGSQPSSADLFGPNFNPAAASPLARQRQFTNFRAQNPWNNGDRNILCLTHGSNTLGALFALLGHCGIENATIPANAVCGSVDGFCVDGRNSDPFVCVAAQDLRRNGQAFSLADPAGIKILRLEGIWKVNGNQIDINNHPIWKISRNGRRAVLEVTAGLTMVDDPITTGTQVSTKLKVGAPVVSADENLVPEWAKTGQESTRRVTD